MVRFSHFDFDCKYKLVFIEAIFIGYIGNRLETYVI